MTKPTLPPENAGPESVARTAVEKALAPKPQPTGPKARKTPIRTCVACREESQKRDLVRIVRTTSGDVVLDATGRMNGRGAYLHPKIECLKLAVKRKALDRALGSTPPSESLAALEAEMIALQDASTILSNTPSSASSDENLAKTGINKR
jgi:predicted RNA-binding protein YlxR (DUF448 family)